ncbi:MAG: chemotaxis protein CheW [Porticoccaceae bacterium]|nr:chemotaxis protein CheW [Porticoccaceae bacterium]
MSTDKQAAKAYCQLAELARRYADKARSLPAQSDVVPTRGAVCFRLLGQPLAVLLEEVSEVVEVPPYTRLPGVKQWVRGIANVRGKLIPIIDLARFLGGRLQAVPQRQRVLLVEQNGIAAGLIVDEVLGAKYFRVDAYSEQRQGIPPSLARFVSGIFLADKFLTDKECWALFRPEALLGYDEFLAVSVTKSISDSNEINGTMPGEIHGPGEIRG